MADESKPLSSDEAKGVEIFVGNLLCCGRELVNTMILALGCLAAAQTKVNDETMKELAPLLKCASTCVDAKLRHHKSGMILHIHSEGSCLSVSKIRGE